MKNTVFVEDVLLSTYSEVTPEEMIQLVAGANAKVISLGAIPDSIMLGVEIRERYYEYESECNRTAFLRLTYLRPMTEQEIASNAREQALILDAARRRDEEELERLKKRLGVA